MPTRYMRRLKTGDFEVEVRLYGPLSPGQNQGDVPAVELLFVDTRIDEVQDGGEVQSKIRSVAELELEAGQQYVLGWTMWGAQGVKLELALDKPNPPPAVKFKTVVKDELPTPGLGVAHSRRTPSGLLWINAKHIEG